MGVVESEGFHQLLIFLLLVAGSYGQDIVFEDALPINNDSGCPQSTECVLITSCPSATADVKTLKSPICGFNKWIPYICCNILSNETESKVEIINPVLPANKMQSECGKIGSRQLPQRPMSDGALNRRKRVVGGRPVLPSTFWPWVGLVGERDSGGEIKWLCVANLINENWLISAVHCFLRNEPTIVLLGEYDYSRQDEVASPQDFEIEQVIYHPNYSYPTQYNDVALIRINRTEKDQDNFSPVCLPWGDEANTNVLNQDLLLIGWGSNSFGSRRSPIPYEVNMTVFESTVCNNSYSTLRTFRLEYPRGIDNSFLCMGAPEGGISACQGDSGGPLMYRNAEAKYVLTGVVSHGYGCGAKDFPGVHSNLMRTSVLSWIREVAFL